MAVVGNDPRIEATRCENIDAAGYSQRVDVTYSFNDLVTGTRSVVTVSANLDPDNPLSEQTWWDSIYDLGVDAFLVPPMQLVAATLNFVTLLAANRHMLELPLTSVRT